MNYEHIPAGRSPPEDINIVIEIPAHSPPIKYEADKDWGVVVVDRFMPAPMFYPANYGFIPNTHADDGDPLDALIITPHALMPGCVIRGRPVGILHMADEEGEDAKLMTVPHGALTPLYDSVNDITDLPELLRRQIEHFFTYYKKLEANKWVRIDGWETRGKALEMVRRSLRP